MTAFRWVVEMMGESGKIGLFRVGYRDPVRPLTVVTLVELDTGTDRVFLTFVKGRVETVNADRTRPTHAVDNVDGVVRRVTRPRSTQPRLIGIEQLDVDAST
jgi:hypothetical protein